nr:MAG TPA: minor structural protein [Caudoviricetes sp.]
MALTRKLLKGMGLTDEQVDTIIEAHGDTVDGLKEDIQRYKADAEKLPGVQKELDDLKKYNGDDFKARYEKERQDFQAYKDGIAKKEAAAAKEKAARAYFESKGIPAKSMGLVIRGAKGEIESLELDGEKIKDASALDSLLDGDYKGLIGRAKKTGTETETPPDASGGAKSRAEIYKKDDKGRYILSAAERQKALAESMASESE